MTINYYYYYPENCFKSMCNTYSRLWKSELENVTDDDSKLKSYLSVNPELKVPVYNIHYNELDRIILTRYRTGAHTLAIERGRWTSPITLRENRVCVCGNTIQSLKHCLLYCPLLANTRSIIDSSSLEKAINSNNIIQFISEMETILKL